MEKPLKPANENIETDIRIQQEFERLEKLSDEELEAEIRAEGEDPDDLANVFKRALDNALTKDAFRNRAKAFLLARQREKFAKKDGE